MCGCLLISVCVCLCVRLCVCVHICVCVLVREQKEKANLNDATTDIEMILDDDWYIACLH